MDEPFYNVYYDKYNRRSEIYVFDIPEYALREELESFTAVGDIVGATFDYNERYKCDMFQIIDSEGNLYPIGINNKYVYGLVEMPDGSTEPISFACMNMDTDNYYLGTAAISDEMLTTRTFDVRIYKQPENPDDYEQQWEWEQDYFSNSIPNWFSE